MNRQEEMSKIPWQGFELMLQGLELYNRMLNSWLNAAGLSLKGHTEEAKKESSGTMSNLFDYTTNQFFRPLQSLTGFSEMFRIWQNFFSLPTPMSGITPQKADFNKYKDYSMQQQDRISKLADNWINYMNSMGDVYSKGLEGKADGQMVDKTLDSSESMLEAWLSFITEESRECFRMLRSSIEIQAKETAEQFQMRKEQQPSWLH